MNHLTISAAAWGAGPGSSPLYTNSDLEAVVLPSPRAEAPSVATRNTVPAFPSSERPPVCPGGTAPSLGEFFGEAW